MKKTLISMLIILFGVSLYSQQLARQNYSNANNSQRTWAWILTVGGGAMIVGGIISYASESTTSYYPGKEVGTGLMIGGAVAVTGGILLFSAANKNEKKSDGMAAGVRLKMQNNDLFKYNHKALSGYPAIAVQFNIK